VWDGGGSDVLASDGANWVGGRAPRSGDSVWYDATSSKTCFWDDAVDVDSFTLAADFTGTVYFKTSSTVTVVEVAGGSLQMPSSSTVTVTGALRLDGSGGMNWGRGRLRLKGDMAVEGGGCCSWVSNLDQAILEVSGDRYQVLAGTGQVELPTLEVNSSSSVAWGFAASPYQQAQAVILSSGDLRMDASELATSRWTQTGGTFEPGASTIAFVAVAPAVAAEAAPLAGQPFANVRVGRLDNSPVLLTALAPLTMTGGFTISTGAFHAGAYTHTAGGDWLEPGGPSSFDAGGRLVLSGSASRSVSFSAGSALQAVEVDSPSTTTFLTAFSASAVSATAAGTSLVFEAGSTVTVAGLTLGAPGLAARVALRSSTPGSPWHLVVTSTASAVRVDAADSDASGGLTVPAADGTSLNSGGDRNWDFGDPPPAAPGTPQGTALGVSSVSWTWAASARAEEYKVLAAAGGAVLAAPATTAWLETGLAPDSTAAVAVEA
ncbi:MAG: hypothetical protein KGL53_09300, partial [Elusimicrobia bacterium]|nr:hypothetical protein [Elusimicrobiota bacterium]